jgi:hypothetical protein
MSGDAGQLPGLVLVTIRPMPDGLVMDRLNAAPRVALAEATASARLVRRIRAQHEGSR